MGTKWTDEQKRVIEERGKNLLVSAAAGSGKTAVLTERIISLITDKNDPVDIDRMLVLTFTEAAASEMKERIGRALEKKLEEQPSDERLRKQSIYIDHAHISTVHSFCSYVIRNYFHGTGIDPSLRLMDEVETDLLVSDVMDDFLENRYEEEDADLLFLTENYLAEKNADAGLSRLIKKIFEFAEAAPWPHEWLEKAKGRLEDACTYEGLSKFLKSITGHAYDEIKNARLETLELIRTASQEKGPSGYLPALESDLAMYDRFLSAEGFEEQKKAADSFEFAKLSSKKQKDEDPSLRDYVKNARNELKPLVSGVRDGVFASDLDEIKSEMEYCLPVVKALCGLTGGFIQAYTEAKISAGVMDFSDLEHFALDILVKRGDSGNYERTDAARELASFFSTVMTDEYQDTNEVQELILGSVSGEKDGIFNRFMVGDIKQAIYGFRHARPGIFIEKYEQYAEAGEGRARIDLNRNFRSRKTVLDTVNLFFSKLMSGETGGIEYDEAASLVYGQTYEDQGADPVCEIILADKKDSFFAGSASPDKYVETEARIAAKHIKRLMKSMTVKDKGTNETRPLRYSDIVILMRSVSSVAGVYTRVLAEEGIPAYSTLRNGYFRTQEVSLVLDYLRVLDNPIQDIPLAAVLFSPIGGLTASELALIRCSGNGQFNGLCREYADSGADEALRNKLKKFFGTLESFRKKVVYTPVHKLIREILNVTGFGTYAASMPAGEQRFANLEMLESKALEYEKQGSHGLFTFIRYIEQMTKNGLDFGEADLAAGNTDAVGVISVHKSKGLEYPVVFLCGSARSFNKKDLNSSVLLNYESGIGVDAVSIPGHTRKNTIYKKTVRLAAERDMYGEELRILYVALTRAREKLIITGVASDLASSAASCALRKSRWKNKVPGADILRASCYLDWIFMTLASDRCFESVYKWAGEGSTDTDTDFGTVKISVESAGALAEGLVKERRTESAGLDILPRKGDKRIYDENAGRILAEQSSFVYPYEGTADIPAKMSVSELKKLAYEEGSGDEGEAAYAEKPVFPYVPEFIKKKETGLSPAEKGTAFHKLLENLDLKSLGENAAGMDEALRLASETAEMLVKKGRLSEAEKGSIDMEKAAGFILSDIGTRMRLADCRGELKREAPFTMSVRASEIRPEYREDEFVIVQGVIDAYFPENGKYILVDYKTDRVNSMEELVKRYEKQLDHYAAAIERSTGSAVVERIIYSVSMGRSVKV